jgi:hypothetical protein
MSLYQGNFHEIVKALRDAIPSNDMSYKTLNLGIILNHVYLISKNGSACVSNNDEKLLRQLMEQHDPETLAEWDAEDKAEEVKKKIRMGCGCPLYQPCDTCGKYKERK